MNTNLLESYLAQLVAQNNTIIEYHRQEKQKLDYIYNLFICWEKI